MRGAGDSKSLLNMLDELGRGIADQEVDRGRHGENLEMLEGGGGEDLAGEHEVAHGDDRDQRRVLEDRYEEVAERRYDDAQRLGQDDAPPKEPARHAYGEAGFPLALGDRPDAAAQDLVHTGAVLERDTQHS